MRVSTALLISFVLVGCHREAAVTFGRRAAPAQVEVSSTQALSLQLMVGVGEDVEPQTHETDTTLRARVERAGAAQVVRWLEHSGVTALEGRSFTVNGGQAISVESGAALERDQAADTLTIAQGVTGPDAVQVALMQQPLPMTGSSPHLDAAFAQLARRALGDSAVVENATLRLESVSETVATFSASLDSVTVAGPVTMRTQLHGSLEVRRVDTLPVTLMLEGPIGVTSTPSDDEPRLTGEGTLSLSRRLVPLETADDSSVVSASARLRAMLSE
ncbi:MAG: hypothetical protein Q8S33_38155 [Myxococcales bacterium]|nr:hypothetical protein [Myxococcales bacterium]